MKTILVVDDEYANVEVLTYILEDAGYRVVSATNGEDGLHRATADTPDLVLSDLMMPIADGRVLLRGMKTKKALRSVPVVMMSAAPPEALGNTQGMVVPAAFLRKPFAVDELLAIIGKLVGKAKAKRARGAVKAKRAPSRRRP